MKAELKFLIYFLKKSNKHEKEVKNGAGGRIRTADPLITNQLLWPTELHRLILYQKAL